MTTVDTRWCERADVIGYQLAKGKSYVDCSLANTGTDNLLPMVVLASLALIVFGYLVWHTARTGRA